MIGRFGYGSPEMDVIPRPGPGSSRNGTASCSRQALLGRLFDARVCDLQSLELLPVNLWFRCLRLLLSLAAQW